MNAAQLEQEPLVHRRENAAARLQISLRTLDELIATKEIDSAKIRGRRVVSEEAIQRYIRKREKSGR